MNVAMQRRALHLGKQITSAIESGAKETLRSQVNQTLAVCEKIAEKSSGFRVKAHLP
jgi:hypothetical protein